VSKCRTASLLGLTEHSLQDPFLETPSLYSAIRVRNKFYIHTTGKIVTNSRDRVILIKLIVCHLFKFSSFEGHTQFISVFSSLPLVHTLNLINPIYSYTPHPIYVRSTFRVSYNLCLDISGICSLQVFGLNLYTHCFIFSCPPATRLGKNQQNLNKYKV
jgi:hypothetical protein